MINVVAQRTGLKLQKLPKNAKHEQGKTYYNGYWQQTYTVTEYTENTGNWMSWSATCEWQDGHITTHCTSLDPMRDYLVLS